MKTPAAVALLTAAIAAAMPTATVSAKPDRVPVRVDVSPPPMKTGDEATVAITLRALEDIDRLEASIAPVKGIDLLSETTEFAFTGVKKGQGRDVVVRVRLTDPQYGSLALIYRTLQGRRFEKAAVTIVFGGAGH